MKNLIISELDHVAYVKLHRPEVRNAFNAEMISEITETFKILAQREDLSAIVLQGEGKTFCAGADLTWMKEMVNYSLEENKVDSIKLYEMFNSISLCPIPVIGLVHGAVFGGALGLVACCDYVISEEGTQFCFSEVKLGIAPAVISAFVLKKVALGPVLPLMISGTIFDGHVAKHCGLVHEISAQGNGGHDLQKVVHRYHECGPKAVRQTKKLVTQLQNHQWELQKDLTTNLIAELRVGSEGQEGLKSFLEKRTPSWRKSKN